MPDTLTCVCSVFVPFSCVCHGPGVSPGRMPASAWCLLPRHRLLRPCRDKRHVNPRAMVPGAGVNPHRESALPPSPDS